MNIQAFEEQSGASAERPPVLVVRHGRGRTGGSTFLDFLIQRARRAGREVIIGDGDKGNPTLAAFYPAEEQDGARQPISADIADVSEWVTTLSGEMALRKASLVLDLGGGDRVLAEHARDMNLPEFCEDVGATALGVFMIGPDKDDFEHVLSIFRAGYFRAEHSILVLNYNLVKAGKNAVSAFEWLESHSGYSEMLKRGSVIRMEKLACMEVMRAEGLSLNEAIEGRRGKSGVPFDPARAYQVKVWMNKMEKQFRTYGIEDWLP
ncbi:hypothetical protein [Methylocella tundrae]|uniref:CobQ/CobB/MinD/ParA nucleotide binding domain-containing protein n=1 Tax=Methylocella tundrae TaxID=227605 RepID=A0A4U8Z7Q8_METTU|nr:hypothetical protein [Methylocella tundrae]WPP02790.1 hypothetical protein SIN04_00335 [Methylocella tundrae]VFU17586.1 conserved protein of unknown function [Methylocella tundrae]